MLRLHWRWSAHCRRVEQLKCAVAPVSSPGPLVGRQTARARARSVKPMPNLPLVMLRSVWVGRSWLPTSSARSLATVAQSVAVFDFELIDTSLEGAIGGARPDEQERLARLRLTRWAPSVENRSVRCGVA